MSAEREADALRWLAFAIGDLDAARSGPGRRVRARIVAFHCQQSVEKALKATLVLAGIDPPRTHDLNDLRNRLPTGWRVKARLPDLGRLTAFVADSRYPDDVEPVTPIESATAVRQANAVLRIIREDFERRGIDTSRIAPQ
jgi:HEPN domain-containing protein